MISRSGASRPGAGGRGNTHPNVAHRWALASRPSRVGRPPGAARAAAPPTPRSGAARLRRSAHRHPPRPSATLAGDRGGRSGPASGRRWRGFRGAIGAANQGRRARPPTRLSGVRTGAPRSPGAAGRPTSRPTAAIQACSPAGRLRARLRYRGALAPRAQRPPSEPIGPTRRQTKTRTGIAKRRVGRGRGGSEDVRPAGLDGTHAAGRPAGRAPLAASSFRAHGARGAAAARRPRRSPASPARPSRRGRRSPPAAGRRPPGCGGRRSRGRRGSPPRPARPPCRHAPTADRRRPGRKRRGRARGRRTTEAWASSA